MIKPARSKPRLLRRGARKLSGCIPVLIHRHMFTVLQVAQEHYKAKENSQRCQPANQHDQ